MRVHILAIGRAGQGAEAELAKSFLKRLPWPAAITELEDRKADDSGRTAREGALLLSKVPQGARVVVLDERGRQFTSRAFADKIGAFRDEGIADLCFLIGGASGHDESVRARADLLLSLSSLTWPHQLARVMLCEQLYRASSILAGHPYHRD